MIEILPAATVAFAIAAVATPLVIRLADTLHLVDAPDGGRRIHAVAVPRLGGVAVWAAVAATLAAAMLLLPIVGRDGALARNVTLGATLLFLVGLIDDLRGVPPAVKVLAQCAGAAMAIRGGLAVEAVGVGAGTAIPTGAVDYVVVAVWIVVATNAFNLIDGLNGLAGGIGVVASATIAGVALLLDHGNVALIAATTGAALLGFLGYNFPRARIFLGDSGSMSVGYLLAVLSVRAATLPNGVVLALIPAVALFLPLVDASLAILRRWLRRQPVSGADARHIHHRLIALGLSQPRTAVLLWLVAAGVSIFGVVVQLTPPAVALGLTVAGALALLTFAIYATRALAYHEFRVAGEVLRTGPAHVRRVISDQIQAHDVSVLLRYADSTEDMSRILDANASRFGFEGMELHALDRAPAAHTFRRRVEASWRLEYPLFADRGAEEPKGPATHAFSVWCRLKDDARPYGAERVARILAPVIEYRLGEILRSISPPARVAGGRSPTPLRVRKVGYPKLL